MQLDAEFCVFSPGFQVTENQLGSPSPGLRFEAIRVLFILTYSLSYLKLPYEKVLKS